MFIFDQNKFSHSPIQTFSPYLMAKHKFLLIVCGPTASGKTSLGINLARHFGTSILSADSRQFYREMNIGTAKPTPEERSAAPHHFIDSLSIKEDYSVGDFEREAINVLTTLFKHHQVVVMVGGSGLFIDAVCNGMDHFPEVSKTIRAALIEKLENEGLESLQEELKLADPIYYEQVDLQNPNRVTRALEVFRASGQPFSFFQNKKKPKRAFNPIKICINWERDTLYNRINKRVDQMLEEGLLEEAKHLLPYRNQNALQTVGYKELFEYIDNNISLEEAIRLIKRNTRRYAKRQLTWFRKDESIQYFEPEKLDEVIPWVEKRISVG